MRLIVVTFIQCEEVWGGVRGLNSMPRSFPTLRLASSHCSWYIVRGYIQHFSSEYMKRILRSLRHERAFECREFVFIDIRENRLSGSIRRYV
jgi:hypothetical protein